MSNTIAEIKEVRPSKSNEDYVVAFTKAFKDENGVVHTGKVVPFHKDDAETLDLKPGDKVSIAA